MSSHESKAWLLVATLFPSLAATSIIGMVYGYPQALWVWAVLLFVNIEHKTKNNGVAQVSETPDEDPRKEANNES